MRFTQNSDIFFIFSIVCILQAWGFTFCNARGWIGHCGLGRGISGSFRKLWDTLGIHGIATKSQLRLIFLPKHALCITKIFCFIFWFSRFFAENNRWQKKLKFLCVNGCIFSWFTWCLCINSLVLMRKSFKMSSKSSNSASSSPTSSKDNSPSKLEFVVGNRIEAMDYMCNW